MLNVPTLEKRFELDMARREELPAESYGLMSSAAFRRYRDQHRQQFIDDNLERLKDERLELWRQYLHARWRIRIEKDNQKRKHLEDDLYAEKGIAWQWAHVDAQISAMQGYERGLSESKSL